MRIIKKLFNVYSPHFILNPILYRFIWKRKLSKLIQNNIRPIIVFPQSYRWNGIMFQRPQHIAMQLAKRGFLYFFQASKRDKILGVKKITENLYLIQNSHWILNHSIKKIIHFYSNYHSLSLTSIQKYLSAGNTILYEYPDEIEVLLSSKFKASDLSDKHKWILKNEQIKVIATSDKLYNEISQYRKKNYILCPNGVTLKDFQKIPQTIPEIVQKIQSNAQKIIGYYGALASWFDYDLVKKIASQRKDFHWLLIGKNFERSLNKAKLDKFDNITVLPPLPYHQLVDYAAYFDIATIPFKLNKITESTSPVKLFEYMALGKPIVSTDLPECRKYQSVLIAKDSQDFINKIELALQKQKDHAYQQLLLKEASENTWDIRGKQIVDFIKT